MKVKAPTKAASAAVEYFLYVVIILQTAIAAFAYKVVAGAAQFLPNVLLYLGFIYFFGLAWAFFLLNRLHRNRKRLQTRSLASEPEGARASIGEIPALPAVSMEPVSVESQPRNAPVMEAGETGAVARALPVFGLTRTQLAVILLVFLVALKLFSWALANVVRR